MDIFSLTLFSFLSILIGLILLFILVLVLFSSPYPESDRVPEELYFLDVSKGEKVLFPSLRDDPSVTLSVIIPAYNEEDRLPVMLEECLEYLEKRQKSTNAFTYELIIVSDGSTDKTVEVAYSYSKKYGSDKIRVLNLLKNRGKGGAVTLGMLSARGAVLLFADADGATKFSDLQKLEQYLTILLKADVVKDPSTVASKFAIVCGSRAHLEEEAVASRTILRILLMHGFHLAVSLLATSKIQDTQCGFKLFTRKTALVCFSNLHVKRWAFDVELLFIADQFSFPVSEVAVNWTEIPGSKIVPVLSWIQMGRDLVLIWLRYKLGAWKLLRNPDYSKVFSETLKK